MVDEWKIKEEVKNAAKPVEFPEARELSDLFEVCEPIDDLAHWEPKDGFTFCAASEGVRAMQVKPTARTQKVLDSMLQDLRITFMITLRGSGTALITAEYTEIIGSRWLAIIDANRVLRVALPEDDPHRKYVG